MLRVYLSISFFCKTGISSIKANCIAVSLYKPVLYQNKDKEQHFCRMPYKQFDFLILFYIFAKQKSNY